MTLRLFRGRTYCLGSKSGIWPPNRTLSELATNRSTGRIPLCPRLSACQKASQPIPIGETTPAPVMTMSRVLSMTS